MRKLLASTPSVLIISFLVGYAFHSIKGVSDPRTLWVGNLSWPYILVPAIACAGDRSLRSAMGRSIGATVAMVLGFYNVLFLAGQILTLVGLVLLILGLVGLRRRAVRATEVAVSR